MPKLDWSKISGEQLALFKIEQLDAFKIDPLTLVHSYIKAAVE